MTICATARPCPGGHPEAFDIGKLTMPASVLKDAAGEELAIRSGRLTVRLCIEAGTLLAGPVMLDFRLGGRRELQRRLLALRQFEALLRLGRIPHALQGGPRNMMRSELILRTLDAMADHRRVRAVASELYGTQKVDADWYHASDYLRMKTRRLMTKARRLATGGYLDLIG
ncbi:Protein of unknown function DUF2285 [Sphingobium chlorophenolicum L-1]|uniref:T6SS Transcription factor RovC-like DNA binding domain-containing protein n=1 Tax=Sphingobium chlorophenolicum L-1 TaxID=690566 RepID=F6F0P1_SPHCR|nr:Protein of unknown function DUF2285 [Sphingobium chlorophenolicum L-1]